MIATIIVMHVATVRAIATNATIAIDTAIAAIDTTTIVVLATKTQIETSAMLAAIATKIAKAIAIAITKIASTIEATAIKKPIAILDRTMVPKRTIMPCTLMLAAA